MKKLNKIILPLLLVSVAIPVMAAPVSLSSKSRDVLATVRVGKKTEKITGEDLALKVDEYKKLGATATDEEILEVLINDKVFLMSAEQDGVKVTDSQIDNQIRQARSQLEAQAGQAITDSQFESLVTAQYGMPMDKLRESLKNQAILAEYLRMKRPNDLNKEFKVSDSEVNSFYRKNSSQFVSPESVRLAHIYKAESDKASTNQKNLKELQKVLSDVEKNKVSFEEAVEEYSDEDSANSKAKGGDIGWVSYSLAEVMGEEFIDAAMNLKVGRIHDEVVHSPLGYHIIKATAKNPQKFLTLDDKVSPDSDVKLKDYISQVLSAQKSQEHLVKVTNELVDELRSKAKITYSK